MNKRVEYLFGKKIETSLLVISFISFVLLALDIVFDGAIAHFDKLLYQWSLAWHTPLLDRLFYNITKMGSLSTMLFISLLISLLLLWRREIKNFLFYTLAMIGSSLLFSGLKELFARDRPSDHIGELLQYGYSFPSGHATMSMTLAFVLFYLLYHKVTGGYRVAVILFALLFPLLVGFSRIYLGVHYFSDVSAGLMLGIFWVVAMSLLLHKKQQ